MRTTPYLPCALLLATTLLWACEKEETPADEPGSNASLVLISDASIVIMDVNGNTVTLEAGGGSSEIITSTVTGGPPPDTSAAVYLAGFKNGVDTLFRLRIGTLEFTGGTPTTDELQDFLAVGSRALNDPVGGSDGLTLEWRNASGQWFGTSCGTAGESGSFEITHIAQQQIGQDFYVKIRAVFSGTFHRCDGTAGTVDVTDGVLVLRFEDES